MPMAHKIRPQRSKSPRRGFESSSYLLLRDMFLSGFPRPYIPVVTSGEIKKVQLNYNWIWWYCLLLRWCRNCISLWESWPPDSLVLGCFSFNDKSASPKLSCCDGEIMTIIKYFPVFITTFCHSFSSFSCESYIDNYTNCIKSKW